MRIVDGVPTKAGNWDLVATSALALAAAAVVTWVPITGVRIACATAMCLVLPGYAVTSAVFARHRLSLAYWLILTVAMSLSVLALGSLALQALPRGLGKGPWTALLLVVVLSNCAVAAFRRLPGSMPVVRLRLPTPGLGEGILLLLAALLTAGAFALAETPLPARNVIGYTQLWINPSQTQRYGVEIGVRSGEVNATAYRLVVALTPSLLRTFRFVLAPGQRFERSLLIGSQPASTSATESTKLTTTRVRVTALLYRASDAAAAYRRVFTWVDVGPRPR